MDLIQVSLEDGSKHVGSEAGLQDWVEGFGGPASGSPLIIGDF